MSNATHLTVGEVAVIFGLPQWKIRRAVDSIHADIPRAGMYRLIPRTALGMVAAELQRRGWLPVEQEAVACK